MSKAEFVGPALYPVINNEHVQQTLRDVEVVFRAGVDGVFLYNHGLNAASLITRYRAIKQRFPDAFVGLNFFRMLPHEVYKFLVNDEVAPDAIFTSRYPTDPEEIAFHKEQIEKLYELHPDSLLPTTKLFAGNTHRNLRDLDDPLLNADTASTFDGLVDFIATCGTGSGLQTPIEKLIAIRDATLQSKLAVASGVATDNIIDYVPYVDAVLVDSIESRFGEIDPERLRVFMLAFRYSIVQERERRDELASNNDQVEPNPIDQLLFDFA